MMRTVPLIHFSLRKRLLASGLGVAAGLWRGGRAMGRSRPARERSVVILEPFGLGDVISHEPLVRLLGAHHYDVTFCGAAAWRSLLPGVNWVDSEIAWGRHAAGEKYPLQAYTGPKFRDFLRTLSHAAHGAIGLDTRGDIRSVLLLYLAGCRRVVSLSRYLGSDLKMPRHAAIAVEVPPGLRRWESNLCCAAPLGLEARSSEGPRLAHFIETRAGSVPVRIALVPVAPWRGKWWPAENWRALAGQLAQRGCESVGLCGPGQRDAAEKILQTGGQVQECGSVAEWAARLQKFDFIITLDSGPMHLNDALGRPVVALFGQGSLPLWAPTHADSVVVTHQGDPDFRLLAPTEANTSSGEEFMGRITVGEVLQAVDGLLARQSARHSRPDRSPHC